MTVGRGRRSSCRSPFHSSGDQLPTGHEVQVRAVGDPSQENHFKKKNSLEHFQVKLSFISSIDSTPNLKRLQSNGNCCSLGSGDKQRAEELPPSALCSFDGPRHFLSSGGSSADVQRPSPKFVRRCNCKKKKREKRSESRCVLYLANEAKMLKIVTTNRSFTFST